MANDYANIGTLSPEMFQQQQELTRQQRMAEMLMGNNQQPQGQMISGRYVAPSWAAQLAPVVNMLAGSYLGQKADEKALDYAKKLRENETTAMADFMQQKQGRAATPDQVTELAGPYAGNVPMPTATIAGQPAIAANPQAAYANLYSNPNASAAQRQFAFTKMNEGPIKLGAEETLLDPTNAYKPIATGGEKTSPEIRTAAQMLGIRGTPETWNPQQTQAVANQVLTMKRAGATNVSVNAANKFSGGFAEKASGGAYNLFEAAQNAPQAIENAKQTINLVNGGAFTGPTADVALKAAKLFNVAGADNQDTIAKTELLAANRGKALLASVKGSGLAGSQGLTEGERRFLTDAEGGRITLNADTLKAMATLEIKLAVQNQKRWNAQASKMDPEILRATGAGPVEVYTGVGTIDASNPLLK
jgi:hypothetical protein